MKLFKRQYLIYYIFIIVVIVRLLHLNNVIDDPHAWRQYDTKQYIESLYEGKSFLAPEVCWMGEHKTLILEFPLPEYLIAAVYKITGPNIIVGRLVLLLFFLLFLYYLYKLLKLYFSDSVPEIAVFVIGMMPLSLFYSRAIHIDFFVLAFVMASFYYLIKSVRMKSRILVLLTVVIMTVVALVKSPYILIILLPALFLLIHEKKFRWILSNFYFFLLPVIALYFWVSYSKHINASAPDWSFIPNYNNFTNMWYWYFGTWDQRMNLYNWETVGFRILREVTGYTGLVLCLIGLMYSDTKDGKNWVFWLLGSTIIYVLVFFNLNVIHNYYQLPFVVSLGILMAMGIQYIMNRLKSIASPFYSATLLCAIFTIESVTYAETNYYTVNKEVNEVAEIIRENTKKDDSIIVSYGGLTPQCPIVLQPANRFGWSIPIHDFRLEQAVKLWKDYGADYLALVYFGELSGELQSFYNFWKEQQREVKVFKLSTGENLYLFKLDFTYP